MSSRTWAFSGGSSLVHKTWYLGITDKHQEGLVIIIAAIRLWQSFDNRNIGLGDYDQINLCHALPMRQMILQ
jgi:hypothetical protein